VFSSKSNVCPGYGFEQHKGYAVPEHLDALDRLGPTVHHRRFFAPVVAARAKHEGVSIESLLGAVQVRDTVEVSMRVHSSS